MIIITDTREQLPYWTDDRQTLIVGDYTTKKLYGKFHIERKSLSDLYGTLVQGNHRFKAELFRAAYHHISIVVYVEGTKANFIAKNFPKGRERKFTSAGLAALISTFEKKYYLEFQWLASRNSAKKAVFKRLGLEEKNKLK